MVMSSPLVMAVANVSAELCQHIACNPERLSSDQVLHLIFCFPFQQFRQFALCLCTFFCFPSSSSSNPFLSSSSSSSSFDYDSDDSHSD